MFVISIYNFDIYNRYMSQWKLPVIDSKKQVSEDQDYNFVNKNKPKSKQQTGALSMVEQLKRKIQEQKKQIENRNATIMGLQRNFQSLSGIVKHQKAQSAALKAELQSLRQNSQTGDKRATEFHQKCIILQNQNKVLKQQLAAIKKTHADCSKVSSQSQAYKNKIVQLELIIEKISTKMDALSLQKRTLQNQLAKLKSQQKNKRVLQQRIVDLQQQLKRSMDINNNLNDRLKLQQDKIQQAKSGSVNNQSKMAQLLRKLKQQQSKRKLIENQNDILKRQLRQRQKQISQIKKNIDNMDVYSKMKQQQDDKMKEELKSAKVKCEQYKQQILKLNQDVGQLQRDNNKKTQTLKVCEKEMELLRQEVNKLKEQFKNKQSKYLMEVDKLTKYVGQLNKEIGEKDGQNKELYSKLNMQSNQKLNSTQKLKGLSNQLQTLNDKMIKMQKYSKYFKQIDDNQSKGVVITNTIQLQRIQNNSSATTSKLNQIIADQKKNIESLTEDHGNMKKYIGNLQNQANLKSKQIFQRNRIIRDLEQQLDMLRGEEKKLADTIAEERRKTQQLKKQSEQQKLKSQKEIEEQRQQTQRKIQQQQQKSLRYKKMLEEYQMEEEKLKKLMANQQDQIRKLAKSKDEQISQLIRQKQQQIQKQRKNNKLLWTDNKKLKDMEQKMREEAEQQMNQIQLRKRQEIEKLKKDLERKYEQQLNIHKEQQSNSNQLKKILQQKAQQVKIITQNHNKTKSQLEFYKNRNKQLEGVVSRTEKNFKDQMANMEKQLKAKTEVVSVLDKKYIQMNLMKQETEKKFKADIQKLNKQISYLKQKYEGQKIQQKIALLKKSMSEFQTTLKAIGNSLSCNYCLQPVKQCVRLKQCGHIYCKKCKAGYQPNCGQCKKSSTEMPDKVVDDTISKSEYMKILINTVKEDLSKISL